MPGAGRLQHHSCCVTTGGPVRVGAWPTQAAAITTNANGIRRQLKLEKQGQTADRYTLVGAPESIPEDRAVIVTSGRQSIAVFKHQNGFSAISNYCRHQGGPLGEGMVIDGCVTCPWHGYQYKPEDGCAPHPFKEKLETFNLQFKEGAIWVSVEANQPGTYVEPLKPEPS